MLCDHARYQRLLAKREDRFAAFLFSGARTIFLTSAPSFLFFAAIVP
jgi:hypothetical protein